MTDRVKYHSVLVLEVFKGTKQIAMRGQSLLRKLCLGKGQCATVVQITLPQHLNTGQGFMGCQKVVMHANRGKSIVSDRLARIVQVVNQI